LVAARLVRNGYLIGHDLIPGEQGIEPLTLRVIFATHKRDSR
jgi:hypothetical protein